MPGKPGVVTGSVTSTSPRESTWYERDGRKVRIRLLRMSFRPLRGSPTSM
jgi:hypothetical protein